MKQELTVWGRSCAALLRHGIPLHTVSKLLGHSDPAMTLRKYAHFLEDMREDAALTMDDLF